MKEETVTKTYRIKKSVQDAIEKMATKEDRSENYVVNKILSEGFKKK